MNQTELLLEFLVQNIRRFTPNYRLDSCLAFSVIGREVLKHYGIKSRMHCGAVNIMTDASYHKLMATKTQADYILSVEMEPVNGEGLGGHFYLEVDGGYLLDLSADQFSRPKHKVRGTRFWRPPSQYRVHKGEIFTAVGPSTVGIYQVFPPEASPGYSRSTDRKPQKHWPVIKALIEVYDSRK